MTAAQPDLLALAERSPQYAAAHDRAGWVGLFTADGRIEDPVGSRPHVGWEQIGRFYDTFIDPRDIRFHRDLDIVGDSFVIRDLGLEVAMGPAVTMHIPAILRYDLRQTDGHWKLARLRAYWELPAMLVQFFRHGRSALPVGAQLASAMLRNQRLTGIAGFAAGFRRPGAEQKRLVDTFIDAIARPASSSATKSLSPGATIIYGNNGTTDAAELGEHLAGACATKMIGAGSTVAASVSSAQRRGVLFAHLGRRGRTITGIEYFPG